MPASTLPSTAASNASVLAARFYEMPGLMGRICGICTISHMMASAQACEAIMSVRVMGTAQKLRKIVNYASLVQSHALAFFHLSSPDFLLGMESDPAQRNIFGLMGQNPEIARDGIRLRGIGPANHPDHGREKGAPRLDCRWRCLSSYEHRSANRDSRPSS